MTQIVPPFGLGRRVAGALAALAVGGLIVTIFWAIQSQAAIGGTAPAIDIAHLLRMTFIQASLTALISIGVGIIIAWALSRLHFPGRGLVINMFGAAIVMPGLVIALGLINVWGRSGWINQLLEPLGMSLGGNIFGLHGILIAHVILDATFAARILLTRLEAIPTSRLKIGRSLGFNPGQRFRIIDWPAISGALPGLTAIIFLLAFTSFPIVLLLGGGPANQTLEVAIYGAVRLDFDLAGAVRLALVQLVVCAVVVLPAVTFNPAAALAGNRSPFHWTDGPALTIIQATALALAVIGFVLPLAAVLRDGITPALFETLTRAGFQKAALTSFAIGMASALCALLLSLTVVMSRTEQRKPLFRAALAFPAYAYLLVPAVVLSLGFFIITRKIGVPLSTAAPFVLVLANTLLSLPYAVSTLSPPFEAINKRYAKLTRSLGLSGWRRWSYVEWPQIGREIGLVLALGFCFSLGDLGVISLFGTEDFTTLPWLMVRAAYRTNDAAAISAILLLASLSAFWLLPKFFGARANAQN